MYLHCPRPAMDEPGQLVDALAACGITAQLTPDQTQIIATVCQHDIVVQLRRQRFLARLQVRETDGRTIEVLSPEYRNALEVAIAAPRSPAPFARRRLALGQVADWFLTHSERLGWTLVPDAIDAEIEYVNAYCAADTVTQEIIEAIRQEQQSVDDAIARDEFAEAHRHDCRLHELLNRLYDYCVS